MLGAHSPGDGDAAPTWGKGAVRWDLAADALPKSVSVTLARDML